MDGGFLGEMNYNWNLKDTIFTKDKGYVFSTFACGGGSTLGFKLSGFNVIGCNEIDPRMNKCYVENHKPKYNFLMDIRELNKLVEKREVPESLFNLDILDGSPPCSSFSLSGNRDKDWGKKKKFKEGQEEQVLDTLFFDYINLAKKLQPKVVIAENVEGLMFGDAIQYVKKIYDEFDKAGYYTQHHLLSGDKMGLPQRRVRVFFICIRKDLRIFIPVRNIDPFNESPYLNLNFNEKEILFGDIQEYGVERVRISEKEEVMWKEADKLGYYYKIGKSNELRLFGFFNKLMKNIVPRTLIGGGCYCIEDSPHKITNNEILKISSFPLDYNFCGENIYTICGMSVPPIMMAKISERIYDQWFKYFPKTICFDLL